MAFLIFCCSWACCLPLLLCFLGAALLGWLLRQFFGTDWKQKYFDTHSSLETTTSNFNKFKLDAEANISDLEAQLQRCRNNYIDLEAKYNKHMAECSDNVVQDASAKNAVKLRIQEKAKHIDFGRIGIASADAKDDLKLVVGIGPFIEEKLNYLGIYTFKQIANFNEHDIEKVNDAIEFFPGRILRDNWVGQSEQLHKEKYG